MGAGWRARGHRVYRLLQEGFATDLTAIADFLARCHSRYQFAPLWDRETLHSPLLCRGLRVQDFLLAGHGEEISACLAIWPTAAPCTCCIGEWTRKSAGTRAEPRCMWKRPFYEIAGAGLPAIRMRRGEKTSQAGIKIPG